MLAVIYGLIVWIVVPLILLAILIFSYLITSSVVDKNNKVSAIAGFWTGMVAFVIDVLWQSHGLLPDFSASSLPGFDFQSVMSTLFGIAFGFCLLWILIFLKTTRFVGIFTLLLSAMSSIAFFNYIFVSNTRGTVMFLAAGVLFGLLLHIVIYPNTLSTALKDVELDQLVTKKFR